MAVTVVTSLAERICDSCHSACSKRAVTCGQGGHEMAGKFSIEEVKRRLSPGRASARKGSKARNQVSFTLHCGAAKASKVRER